MLYRFKAAALLFASFTSLALTACDGGLAATDDPVEAVSPTPRGETPRAPVTPDIDDAVPPAPHEPDTSEGVTDGELPSRPEVPPVMEPPGDIDEPGGGEEPIGGEAPAPELLPRACGPVALRTAPPLPAPTGAVVEVDDVDELVRAVRSAADGTTILVADGTYYLPGLLAFNGGRRDITLRSASGDRDRVILDGSRSSTAELIWFQDVKNVTVADLTVQNARAHCFTVKGEADADGVRIYNNRIRNCWERYVKGTAPNPLPGNDATRPRNGRIEYNLFEQDHPKRLDDWQGGDYIGGVDMMWLKNWEIRGNVFRDIRGRNGGGRGAVFIWNRSVDVLVEDNLFIGNDRSIAFGNPSGGQAHVTRGVMRNNIVVRGANKALELARTVDCTVHNNTIFSRDAGYASTVHAFQGARGLHFHSNLVRGGVRLEGGEALSERNLVGALDGLFVDAAGGDLHLSAAGAREVLGRGLGQAAGARDFDGDLRPGMPGLGADECTP